VVARYAEQLALASSGKMRKDDAVPFLLRTTGSLWFEFDVPTDAKADFEAEPSVHLLLKGSLACVACAPDTCLRARHTRALPPPWSLPSFSSSSSSSPTLHGVASLPA